MVTVMRQRTFHKPNGSLETRKRAKGKSGKPLAVFPDIRPFHASGRWKTKTWKELYAAAPHPHKRNAQSHKEARKLRQKLTKMKMPIPAGRKGNPKKNSCDRRPRRIVWESEKNPSPRYRYDGTIKE